MPVRIRDIITAPPVLAPDSTLGAALQIFIATPELTALPVIFDGIPLGLLVRSGFMEMLIRHQHRPRLMARHVSYFMSKTPLTAEANAPAAYIAKTGSETTGAPLGEGVIAIEDGRYVGYVPALSLLSAVADENAERAKALRTSFQKLDAARQQSVDLRREQTRFLAFLGHEIRTPLTGILGIADLLGDMKLDTEPREYARTIAESGQHLDRLLSDILDLTRLEVGKLAITPEPFKLGEFANEIRSLWAARSQKKGVTLKITADTQAAERIEADPTRLRQILFNLISNGVKFTEKGSVSAHLETQNLPQSGLQLVMRVVDTGAGINDADKARLFEAFEQATPQTVHRYGGTGLGLSIAKGLAEQMGGIISLTDNPDGGTVFTVTCPVRKAGPRLAVENAPAQRKANFQLGRILLVEDHAVSRLVISKALSAVGWSVDVAETVEDGCGHAFGTDYQLILTDLHLGEASGFDLVKSIRRSDGPNRFIPILAVSADVSDMRRQQCLNHGFNGFIEKPIRPRHLVASVIDAIIAQTAKTPTHLRLKAVAQS